jgi:hypothetical protein
VAFREGEIIHISVEVGVASGAAMLGVGDLDIARAPTRRIAQIMQRAEVVSNLV